MSIDKIVYVGKNYLDHAKELGDAVPEKPVLFLKPPSVLKQASNWMSIFPNQDNAVQPECEIELRIAHDGYKRTQEEASNAISDIILKIWGYYLYRNTSRSDLNIKTDYSTITLG